MFVTCWGVKFLGEEIAFTRWGLLSGFMWVVGGCGGIYGIRMAGMAIAVGTWASIMIMINFFFGILMFHEPVYDIWGTVCSFLLLMLGLVGMSHYSSPEQSKQQQCHRELVPLDEESSEVVVDPNHRNYSGDDEMNNYQSMEPTTTQREDDPTPQQQQPQPQQTEYEYHVSLFGGLVSLTKRQCGIAGAVMNGFFTGGSLVPLHYAGKEGFGGARYFPSYGMGAMIANVLMWVVFYAVCVCKNSVAVVVVHGGGRKKSWKESLSEMPRWHFRALWLPGLLAGLMLSLAMFSTIIAITYLGQGVGNSIVQSKILVSGLWGIVWYKEVVGAKTITKWFASAGVCMIAIVWLSFERLEAKAKHGGGDGGD